MSLKQTRKLTQDERSAISDQRLLEAAIKLIVTKGTAGTTLKALGESSGYSRGLVTYRFGTKDGLFKAVIKQVSEQWASSLSTRIGELSGKEALVTCSEAYFQFVQDCPDDIYAMNILNQQACEPDSALKDIVCKVKQAHMWQLTHWIKQGQQQGTVNAELDAEACATQFVAFHSGITFLWMLDIRGFDWSRVHQHSTQQLLKELAV